MNSCSNVRPYARRVSKYHPVLFLLTTEALHPKRDYSVKDGRKRKVNKARDLHAKQTSMQGRQPWKGRDYHDEWKR